MGGALTRMLGTSSLSGPAQSPSLRAAGYMNANTAYTANNALPVGTVDYDPSSIYQAGSNNIKPTLSGYYLTGLRVDYTSSSAFDSFITKSGSAVHYLGSVQGNSAQGGGGTCLVSCNGSTDTIGGGATRSATLLGSGRTYTFLNTVGPFNTPAYQMASAYMSADQTGSGSGTPVKLAADTALFDPASIFSSSNKRFQPTQAGYYIVTARSAYKTFGAVVYALAVYKNGSLYQKIDSHSSTAILTMGGASVVYLNGSTDYVEVFFEGGTIQGGGSSSTYMEILGPFANAAGSYLSGAGSLSSGTTTIVAQDAVLFDPNSWWNGTNKRFVPTQAGYYWCSMRAECTTEAVHEGVLWKNGSAYQTIGSYSLANCAAINGDGVILFLNGSTDYIQPASYRSSAGTLVAGSDKTWFSIVGPL